MTDYRAVLGGQAIAQSEEVVLLEGNVYFPAGGVREEFLTPTRSMSLCPWKGVASYCTVGAVGITGRDAAWAYRHSSPLARRIKDHVAFWGAVRVSEL